MTIPSRHGDAISTLEINHRDTFFYVFGSSWLRSVKSPSIFEYKKLHATLVTAIFVTFEDIYYSALPFLTNFLLFHIDKLHVPETRAHNKKGFQIRILHQKIQRTKNKK